MIVRLVIVILQVMDVFFIVVLKLNKSLRILVFHLLQTVMVLLFNLLVIFMVLSDTVLTLFVDFMQSYFKLVNVLFNLMELLFVSPRRLVPDFVMVHPIVVLEEPLA